MDLFNSFFKKPTVKKEKGFKIAKSHAINSEEFPIYIISDLKKRLINVEKLDSNIEDCTYFISGMKILDYSVNKSIDENEIKKIEINDGSAGLIKEVSKNNIEVHFFLEIRVYFMDNEDIVFLSNIVEHPSGRETRASGTKKLSIDDATDYYHDFITESLDTANLFMDGLKSFCSPPKDKKTIHGVTLAKHELNDIRSIMSSQNKMTLPMVQWFQADLLNNKQEEIISEIISLSDKIIKDDSWNNDFFENKETISLDLTEQQIYVIYSIYLMNDNMKKLVGMHSVYSSYVEKFKKIIDNLKNRTTNKTVNDDITSYILLMKEAKRNGVVKIKELVSSGVNINFQDGNGNTALIVASKNGNIETVQELIKLKSDIYIKNKPGSTALSIALGKAYHSDAGDAYFEICKMLINECNDNTWFEYYFEEAEYALIHASKSNNIDVVKRLINAGMFLDFQDQNYNNRTALIEATIKGNIEIAKLLIKAGAETDIQSDSSHTFSTIGWAASSGYEDIIDELIQVDADLDLLTNLSQMQHTPLLEALTNNHLNIAIKLIEAGANVNVYAYSKIYTEDKQNYDEDGNYAKKYTPLMVASTIGDINIVKKLIDFGANINFQNSQGYTALMWASINKKTEIVKELISAGADMTLQNKEGKTALDLSLESTDKED